MKNLQNIFGQTLPELELAILSQGEKPYRARQLFKWLYNNRVESFDEMTTFSKELRVSLSQTYNIELPHILRHQVSNDGTEKFLFGLQDGRSIETVLIPDNGRITACVSSQVGCALTCGFCATGTMGLLRNLTVGEIVGQLAILRNRYGDAAFSNVVFMGMGEPLHNYEHVLAATKILNDSQGFNFGARRTTISTSGITPKVRKLAESGSKVRLALSLHAASQSKRERIMPVAKTFGLENLMDAIRFYTTETGERVMIEYIVFENFNDSEQDAHDLLRLIRGIPCKINLLPYNPVPGLPFKRPTDEKVDWFARLLYADAPAVTVRKSRGRDIDAACGQLAVHGAQPTTTPAADRGISANAIQVPPPTPSR